MSYTRSREHPNTAPVASLPPIVIKNIIHTYDILQYSSHLHVGCHLQLDSIIIRNISSRYRSSSPGTGSCNTVSTVARPHAPPPTLVPPRMGFDSSTGSQRLCVGCVSERTRYRNSVSELSKRVERAYVVRYRFAVRILLRERGPPFAIASDLHVLDQHRQVSLSSSPQSHCPCSSLH